MSLFWTIKNNYNKHFSCKYVVFCPLNLPQNYFCIPVDSSGWVLAEIGRDAERDLSSGWGAMLIAPGPAAIGVAKSDGFTIGFS